jgi:hypothetical protein
MADARTRRKDRVTLALTVVFVATLAVVFVADEPRLWLGWSILAVVVSGAALVHLNRNTPQEP